MRWVESEKRFVPDIGMKIIAKVLAVSYEEIYDILRMSLKQKHIYNKVTSVEI